MRSTRVRDKGLYLLLTATVRMASVTASRSYRCGGIRLALVFATAFLPYRPSRETGGNSFPSGVGGYDSDGGGGRWKHAGRAGRVW